MWNIAIIQTVWKLIGKTWWLMLLIALAIFVSALITRGNSWKKKAEDNKILALNWELRANGLKALTDSLRVHGVYSKPETTTHDSLILVPGKDGRVDTVPVAIPEYAGSWAFDTSRSFGPNYNPTKIRVRGQVYWPESHAGSNWLQILPEFGEPNALEPQGEAIKERLAIGLGVLGGPRQNQFYAVSARIKRGMLLGGYGFNGRDWFIGFDYEVLRF